MRRAHCARVSLPRGEKTAHLLLPVVEQYPDQHEGMPVLCSTCVNFCIQDSPAPGVI